ncbi:5'-3' exonuclease [Spiroplasma endosymbiont of Aspidapion aeneum]|uniref:5'-3' exonuclease n=1 Tax=Spiroplasma endosymbiont of Aspidapion aeneum TaxID=3066276 RepID=UPI00313D2C9A
MENKKNKIAIIDGYHLLHRGYYGPLKQGFKTKNKDGHLVNSVFVFASRILKMIKSNEYWSIIVAFDISGACWRTELFEKYKATRKDTPLDLVPQMQIARDFLTAVNIQWFDKQKYEGEDIIATIAKKAISENFKVDVFTNDKDLFQLVTEDINVIVQKDKKTPPQRVDPDYVRREFGVEPPQITDMKSLLGDSSDNIRGVKGLKYASAISLINEYGSVEYIIDNIEELPGNAKSKISSAIDQIIMNKKLTTICNDVELENVNFKKLNVNFIKYINFLNENGMYALDKQIRPLFLEKIEELKAKKFDLTINT